MTDITNYTHKWRATTNVHHDAKNERISKRNRQPVSCQPCRTRKLKCDRGHPCDSCQKRNEEESCLYGKLSTTTMNGYSPVKKKDDSRGKSMKVQDRLKHLEDLVRSMAEPPVQCQPISSTEIPAVDNMLESRPDQEPLHQVTVGTGSYASSTHWSAILQHLNELRNDMNSSITDYDDEVIDSSKPDALFGGQRPPSLAHILKAHLPSRVQVDRRISQYFNARYAILPILHTAQFRSQYEKFWENPIEANIMWISIMFSICCIAANLSLAASRPPKKDTEVRQARESFETAAVQCLVLGNYSKPQPYVVEALALFLQYKYSNSLDPQRELALIFGVQIRMAYLMGYHRDGSNLPEKFTPFQAEMRRRTWAMSKQFDVMVSFQLGIPNNIPPYTWDTKNPANLLDADFDEYSKVLPSSRPETDVTQVLYFVVKSRIVDVYARICHHAISFPSSQPNLSEVMSLDASLRQQAGLVPDSLRIRPVSQSVTDPAHQVMVRVNISVLCRKSLCVLHRKYMTANGNDYSYRTCVEAASAICESILDIYPEFQPGGRYENDVWMLTSFTIVDFLLAAIVLCLAMSVSRRKHVNIGGDPQKWLDLHETKSVLEILDKSLGMCLELTSRSREAKRVSGVLVAVLRKLRVTGKESTAGTNETIDHLHMTNGTLKEGQAVANSTSGTAVGKMNSLTISEQPPSTTRRPLLPGLWPSEWTNTSDRASDPSSSSISSVSQVHTSLDHSTTPSSYSQDQPPIQPKTGMSASMTTFQPQAQFVNPSIEGTFDLGPFSNIMSDFDSDSAMIDWTQLDRFTGFYGSDTTNFSVPAMDPQSPLMTTGPSIQGPGGKSTSALSAEATMDYENWESTPLFQLGGRARDPVTGMSQKL